jgi:hypothetical protein
MGFGTRVIYTPAGQCPVKLKGIDYNDVLEWSNLIMESGREKGLNYLPSAILFFSQQFYGVHTKEYNIIKEHIANIFNSNPSIDVEKLERKEIKEEEVNVVEDEVEKNIIKYKKKKK